jgi:hypothetical protein
MPCLHVPHMAGAIQHQGQAIAPGAGKPLQVQRLCLVSLRVEFCVGRVLGVGVCWCVWAWGCECVCVTWARGVWDRERGVAS